MLPRRQHLRTAGRFACRRSPLHARCISSGSLSSLVAVSHIQDRTGVRGVGRGRHRRDAGRRRGSRPSLQLHPRRVRQPERVRSRHLGKSTKGKKKNPTSHPHAPWHPYIIFVSPLDVQPDPSWWNSECFERGEGSGEELPLRGGQQHPGC